MKRKLFYVVGIASLISAVALIVADMNSWRWFREVTQQQTVTNSKPTVYGIALGDTLNTRTSKNRLKMLAEIKQAGFTEVRYNLDWSAIQAKSKDSYDWKKSDAIMKDVKASGLTSIVILDRTPVWDRQAVCKSDVFCAPSDMKAFGDFAGITAERYRGYNVTAWEIWNEPNIVNFWKPAPNPDMFTEMLKESYTAIKKKVPSATVIVGGLAGNALDTHGDGYMDPRTYLDELYKAGAKEYFDGIGYHPYTGFRLPTVAATYNGWQKMAKTNPSMRSLMAENNDSAKKLWLTEFGVPTRGSGEAVTDLSATTHPTGSNHVTEAGQATIARAAVQDVEKHPWIMNFDWYTYADNHLDEQTSGGSYGLVKADGSNKPAYDVLKDLITQ